MPLTTYQLICPNEDCNEEWDFEADPEDLAKGEEATQGPITCETCLEEWEWEYDAVGDTLILIPDDVEDEDGFEDEDDEEDED